MAAKSWERTSLKRLEMRMTVKRWTFVARSLSARARRGTRTARVGPSTSRTQTLAESFLMVSATVSGRAMADTRTGMKGWTSGFDMTEQMAVVALMAALETYNYGWISKKWRGIPGLNR
jgi:hypothetical protein